jgi:IS5 family transposase
VDLDAGYDWKLCRQVLAERGMVGQIAARGCRPRSRLVAGG